MKVAPDHYKILFENDQVRVLENTLAPGEKDPTHTHGAGWYYVTSPGTMKITFPDGKVATWESKPGESAWLKTKSPHADENVGKTSLTWVLVELKNAVESRAAVAAPAKKQ